MDEHQDVPILTVSELHLCGDEQDNAGHLIRANQSGFLEQVRGRRGGFTSGRAAEIGIGSDSPFMMMMDRNNLQVADVIRAGWREAGVI